MKKVRIFNENVNYYINDISDVTLETGDIVQNTNTKDITAWAKKKVALGHADKDIVKFASRIASKINSNRRIKNYTPFMEPAWGEMIDTITPKLKDAVVQ